MKNKRYIRQTSLKDFGQKGQQKLSESRVLVVGLGGLGIPVLQYLNAMGVGTLGLIDQDIVGFSNLQRQVLYTENDVGRPKLEVILKRLKAQNSNTHFKTFDTFLVKSNALKIIGEFDIVVDASDNFQTRYLINDACVILKKPFVYGALHSFEGQVSVFNYEGGATYRCLFPKMPSEGEVPNCDENGVLGVIPGIVGNLQALEVVKVIAGIGEVLSGKLLIFDGLDQSFYKMSFATVKENLYISQLAEHYDISGCDNPDTISPSEFQKLIDSSVSVQLIDVRSAEEYAAYHLPDAINIPLGELRERKHEINVDHKCYLVCQSGARSAKAHEVLRNDLPKGKFINVEGGLNRYKLLCP